MQGFLRGAALAVLIAVPSLGHAQQYVYATTIFGHQIYATKEPAHDRLMVDGTPRLIDGRIDIQEIGLAGDMPVIIGWKGSGGTMCGAVPFVVSFEMRTPKVDVSPLECAYMTWTLQKGSILFETPEDSSGEKFLWTPEKGFTQIAP